MPCFTSFSSGSLSKIKRRPPFTITPNSTNVPEGTAVTFTVNGPDGTYFMRTNNLRANVFQSSGGTVIISSGVGTYTQAVAIDATHPQSNLIWTVRLFPNSSDTTTILAESPTIISPSVVAGEFVTKTSGSWTVPAGVTSISFMIIGGGGGGGGFISTSRGGGGGGGSAYRNNVTVSPGQVISFTIGAGGSGGSSGSSGTNGTASSCLSATAGGGNAATSTSGGAGGAPGGTRDGGGAGGQGGTGSSSGGGGGGGAGGIDSTGGRGGNAGSVGSPAGMVSTAGGGGGGGGSSSRAGVGGGVALDWRFRNYNAVGGSGGSGTTNGGGGGIGITSSGGFTGGGGGGSSRSSSSFSGSGFGWSGNSGGIRIVWPGLARQFHEPSLTPLPFSAGDLANF